MSAFNALNREPGFNYSPEPTEIQHKLFRDFRKVKVKPAKLELVIYVPEKIATGQVQKPYDVHVFWHGGGMLTGDAEYEQWYQEHLNDIVSQGLVVIWPQYRLMPESSGKDIEEDIPKLGYFLSDGSINSYLLKELPDMKACFSLHDIVCSGVSAGGHMAWKCWVEWDRLVNVKVRISLLCLWYSMNSQYLRETDNEYCNVKPTREELKEIALEQLTEAVIKRTSGEEVRGRIPPDHMGSLPLTACITHAVTRDEGSKKFVVPFWKLLWNHPNFLDHVRAWSKPESESNTVTTLGEENGCIFVSPREIEERVGKEELTALHLKLDPGQECFTLGYALQELESPPSYCPQIDFVHGMEDRNCKIQDMREVKSFIEAQYGKECIRGEEVPGEAHGFDIIGIHPQHQPLRQTLTKTNPSGISMVPVPDTKSKMENEGEMQPLDDLVDRRREYKGDGRER